MDEFNYSKLINFWSFFAMGCLILSAVGVFFFRYYTNKKTEHSLTNLAYPLPNTFKVENFSLEMDFNGLEKFLPELRRQHQQNPEMKGFGDDGSIIRSGFQLRPGHFDRELQNLFEGKELHISLTVGGNDFHLFKSEMNKNYLLWKFYTVITLNDYNSTLHYQIDHTNSDKETLILNLYNSGSNKTQQRSEIIYRKSGVSSVSQLCNQKAWIDVDIGNNTDLRAPHVSFKHFFIKDNNSKDYVVDMSGYKVDSDTIMYNNIKKILHKKVVEKDIPEIKMTYMTGLFKCSSI
jgi:hypothetical protein